MKVKIEFEVTTDLDEEAHGELTEARAKSAASEAAYQYLAFVKVAGYTSAADEVEVHVDGFGACTVKLGEDHE